MLLSIIKNYFNGNYDIYKDILGHYQFLKVGEPVISLVKCIRMYPKKFKMIEVYTPCHLGMGYTSRHKVTLDCTLSNTQFSYAVNYTHSKRISEVESKNFNTQEILLIHETLQLVRSARILRIEAWRKRKSDKKASSVRKLLSDKLTPIYKEALKQ